MTLTEMITADATYLSACIEEFRSAADGNVVIPLPSAELLLRNYLRVLGVLAKPTASAQPQKADDPLPGFQELVTTLQADLASWGKRMQAQQNQATSSLATLPVKPPEAAPPPLASGGG